MCIAGKDRVGEYEMKLMDIDTEHLGIPDTVYDAEIQLPSAEFQRIIRDLKELGESVKIEVSKDGIRFSAEGDIGSAAVTLKQTDGRAMSEDEEDEESELEVEEATKEEEDDVSDPRCRHCAAPADPLCAPRRRRRSPRSPTLTLTRTPAPNRPRRRRRPRSARPPPRTSPPPRSPRRTTRPRPRSRSRCSSL